MQIIKYRFEIHGDERGQLVAIEQLKDIPFKIERVYYLYETRDGVRRGFHAHKELEQILVCVHGSCKILLDDGSNKRDVVLNKPNEGLYIPNSIWREMYDFLQMPFCLFWRQIFIMRTTTFAITMNLYRISTKVNKLWKCLLLVSAR